MTPLQWVQETDYDSSPERHLAWMEGVDLDQTVRALCGYEISHNRTSADVGEWVPLQPCKPCQIALGKQIGFVEL